MSHIISKISLAAILILAVAPLAWSHDVIQPPWRGQDGTTYQEWTFDDNDNPAIPEVIDNPYGSAIAAITVGDFGEGWRDSLPGFGTQTGFWDLGGVGGQIVLDIDNRRYPLPYKEIWVQVTYYKDINQAPVINVPGAAYQGGETRMIENVSTGGYWYLDQSMWRIEPNPDHEQIIITSDPNWGSVIDQIVVDTICAPEPVSLAGLILGGLLLMCRRRVI